MRRRPEQVRDSAGARPDALARRGGDSSGFPRRGRAPLWLGYLLLSATILLWVDVTHGADPATRYGELGFVQFGIPVAAWLWIRRGFGAHG